MSVLVKNGRFCKSSENYHAKYYAEYNNVFSELLK